MKFGKSITLLSALLLATTMFAAADAGANTGKKMKSRRTIVVSSLGPRPLQVKPESNEEALKIMQQHWKEQIAPVLPDKPDLIVLPEACDRFPAMSLEERFAYYDFRGDQMRDFFSGIAKENGCYIAYSAARKLPDGSYRNSTQLIGRDGKVAGIYNKNYPTVGETSNGKIIAGKDAPVFETDFGRVCFAICFDLNFHEVLERYAVQRPDLIVFSSMYHGGLMQNYWAYHCRSYFVGSIAGPENNIVNPVGTRVAHSTNYFPRVTATINLDYQVVHLDENWEKLDALKEKYGRGVTVFDPGFVGAVLVSSERDDVTSLEMIREFKIELWDDYYKRSVEFRNRPGRIEE